MSGEYTVTEPATNFTFAAFTSARTYPTWNVVSDSRNYSGDVTYSGVVKDVVGAGCVRTVRLYNRATGELLATTTSASDGSYSFPRSYGYEVQIVAIDDVSGIIENDLIIRANGG